MDVSIDVDGVTLSGRLAMPQGPPRLLIVALHGGGMHSGYFDGKVDPSTSLLTLASRLGHAALSLDRPGYGASTAALADGLRFDEQAQMTSRAINNFLTTAGLEVPVFLFAHSFGMKIALTMAGAGHLEQLIGIDGSGVGVRYNEELASYPGREPDGEVAMTRDEAMRLFWGPPDLYPEGTLSRQHRPIAPVPTAESSDASLWPNHLREIAPKVTVPVRYTVADHETWWDVRPSTLDEFAAMFIASPRVVIDQQVAAGHNISLGRSALAYHLRVAAFADECLLAADRR